MKRMINKYWYVPIVVVVLLMLTLIMLITNQSAYQRITLWLLFVALISLPVSWIWLFIFKERRKALLSILWSIASISILLIPLSIAIISDPYVPNSSSDEKNQPPKSKAMQAERVARTFNRIRTVGASNEVSPQWIKSDSLYAHASVAELIQLASKHENDIERLIAFRALLMKDPHEAANLTISEVDDITLVCTSDGFCGQAESVSDIRISMMLGNRVRSKVTIEDSIRIDSAVLNSVNSSKLNYTYKLYQKLPAKPEYEDRLRQLYKQDKRALMALAKYHKEQDKQEIIRILSKIEHDRAFDYRDTVLVVFDAIAVWPSASFKVPIQHVCKRLANEGGVLFPFEALINYNTRWSYNVIDQALSTMKKKNKNYFSYCWDFHFALELNPHPLYKPLLKKYPLHE